MNQLPSINDSNKYPLENSFYLYATVENKLLPRVFGCKCFVNRLPSRSNKSYTKALECMFAGYSNTQKGIKAIPLKKLSSLCPKTLHSMIISDIILNVIYKRYTIS